LYQPALTRWSGHVHGGLIDRLRKLEIFTFAESEVDFNRIELGDRRKDSCWPNKIAALAVRNSCDAVNQRANFREAHIDPRELHLRLLCLHHGLSGP